jgi:hypothetical protein
MFVFRLDYYLFRKDERGTAYRLPDSGKSVVLAYSVSDAERILKQEMAKSGYIAEIFSTNQLSEVNLVSGQIVSRIINERASHLLNTNNSKTDDLKKVKSLAKVWQNASRL